MALSSIPWILLGLMCLCSAMDIESSKMASRNFARRSRSAGLKKPFHKRQAPGSCGETFTALHGVIHSPNYPDNYEDGLSCTWHIRGSPGSSIELEFGDFFLESDVDDGTCYDSVVVTSGLGDPLGTFCGTNTPPTVVSHDGQMYVYMYSDSSVNYEGFTAHYNVIEDDNGHGPDTGCGGTLTAPEAVIKSPNYPSYYPNDVTCVWQIQAPPGFTIILSANDFELEEDFSEGACNADKLVIEDDVETLGTFCGKILPFDTLQSNSNNLKLTFVSDPVVRHTGFSITYEFARPNTCGASTLTEDSGNITSPNYSFDYGNNLNCEWRIEGPPDSIIILIFDDFRTEGTPGDCYDELTISTEDERLYSFCGETEPDSPIIVSSNVAILAFNSDSSVTYRGFNIRYNIIY